MQDIMDLHNRRLDLKRRRAFLLGGTFAFIIRVGLTFVVLRSTRHSDHRKKCATKVRFPAHVDTNKVPCNAVQVCDDCGRNSWIQVAFSSMAVISLALAAAVGPARAESQSGPEPVPLASNAPGAAAKARKAALEKARDESSKKARAAAEEASKRAEKEAWASLPPEEQCWEGRRQDQARIEKQRMWDEANMELGRKYPQSSIQCSNK